MEDYIYIGQVEIEGDFTPEKAFFTEDEAREWMRERFLELSKENRIPKDDWKWSIVNPSFFSAADKEWTCVSLNYPFRVRIFRFKTSAKDFREVYVCQTTDTEDSEIRLLCFTEDEAREWMRTEFVEYRDSLAADNSRFYWNHDDGWWYCGDEDEHMDWEIFRLPLPE